jgi:hypothetical protein
VYRVCQRHGLNRLPSRLGRRAVHTHRYGKRVPGIQASELTRAHSDPGTEPPALRMRMMPVDETRVLPDHHFLWFTLASDEADDDPCARFLRDRPPATE